MSRIIRRSLPAIVSTVLLSLSSIPAATYTPEPSNRVKINLGVTAWKFLKGNPGGSPQSPGFSDATWTDVGIPHSFNDNDTYLNMSSAALGGFDPQFQKTYKGSGWYRKHFTVDAAYQGRKVFLEFEGVNIACAVYVNGTFIPGGSSVSSSTATHINGFVGFSFDITDKISYGGQDNVLAVRVSNNDGELGTIGFGTLFQFGMGMGGIFRPVYLHITDKVHVPLNNYQTMHTWGTHVATVSATTSAASVRIQTNVKNDYTSSKSVSLTSIVVDAANTVVYQNATTRTVNAGASSVFDETAAISNPHLWYPAHSPVAGATPYMHKVYSKVQVDGITVDLYETPLGIRELTWDADYPYINGVKHTLWGFGQRYEYPALGTAVPEEQQWRDIKLMVDGGGRFVRPGHCASSPVTVAACDAYGVMIAQPSGDNEWAIASASGNMATLKKELHRDLIVRDRNHPSILLWETDNGGYSAGLLTALIDTTEKWDAVHPRLNSPREGEDFSSHGELTVGKTAVGMINGGYNTGIAAAIPNWNAESWISMAIPRDWSQEREYARQFVDEWLANTTTAKCFAYAHWYLAEAQGENGWNGGYLGGTPKEGGRSLGSSAMCGNRIPNLIYRIWQNALWIPFSEKPGVTLQSHWNYSGTTTVDAWSNCASVELFLNGTSLGTRTPDASHRRCTWTPCL